MDLIARLDPELAEVFPSVPRLDLTDIPAARATRAEMAAAARARLPVYPAVFSKDHLVPGERSGDPPVRVRHYRPVDQSGPLPCLYWTHGGGHVLGSVDQDDPFMEHVVSTIGCAAVSVDWRRAPEDPFPASLNDAFAGLAWTVAHAAELGIDPARIAIGGPSSGGGLAAGLALLARDRGGPTIALQLLIYPMLDDRTGAAPHQAIDLPNVWNRASNAIAWRAYLGARAGDDVSPYAAPARATDLSRLPAAFIATGDLDLFASENIEYAGRLVAAGVATELHVYPGAIHGFDLFAPTGRLAKQLTRDRDSALRAALRR